MEKQVTDYLQEAEDYGAKGQIEKSQKFVKKAEAVRTEIDNAKKVLKLFLLKFF